MTSSVRSIPHQFDVGGLSHPGRQRRRNEDYWGSWQALAQREAGSGTEFGHLYLVSDGVGGNEDGDVASEESVTAVMQRFYDSTFLPDVPSERRLEQAIVDASRHVAREVQARRNDMAATLVAALIVGNRLIVANVGDSRAYLVRAAGDIQQLSIDHVRNGNQLTQAMGDMQLAVALHDVRLAAGDIVVLCTDGLHDLVSDTEIKRIVRGNGAHAAARALIRLANRRAGHDNITVVVVRNGPPPPLTGVLIRAGVAIAAALGVLALLLMMLNTIAPVQAERINDALGFRRTVEVALDPTSTLSPIEIKATATTVFVQEQATRGVLVPTVPPVPTRPATPRRTAPTAPVQQPALVTTVPPSRVPPRSPVPAAPPTALPRTAAPAAPSPVEPTPADAQPIDQPPAAPAPTGVPAPPQQPIATSQPAPEVPAPTQQPVATSRPAPTDVPQQPTAPSRATAVPPTAAPATTVTPTAAPSRATTVPATAVPPTAVPPTAVPPTAVPPTAVPPTAVPPTAVPPTDQPVEPTSEPKPTDEPPDRRPTDAPEPPKPTKEPKK